VIHLQSQLLRRYRQEDCKFKANLDKVSETLPQKQNTNKRAGAWLKRPSSIPNTAKIIIMIIK
jgi:hypothetical protein